MYTVHFLAGEREVRETERAVIEGVVSSVYERVHTMLSLDMCDIFFVVQTRQVFFDELFRGSLHNDSSCYVFADGAALSQAITDDVQQVARSFFEHLCGALYSTARIRHMGIGADCGLLEEVINEGLAGHFMSEMAGGVVKDYYITLLPAESALYREKLLEDCNKKHSADVEKWFRGSEKEGIPPLLALPLGFSLVAEYLEKHATDSVRALGVPAAEFVR